jgi:hypothetical protein
LKGNGIVAVEVELAQKRQVGRDFQITRTARNGIVKVDVILLDGFSSFVKFFKLFSFFGDQFSTGKRFDRFGVGQDTIDMIISSLV